MRTENITNNNNVDDKQLEPDKTGRNLDGTFAHGNSGNPNGRPKKDRAIAELIRARLAIKDGDKTNAQLIIDTLISKAYAGDVTAAKFLIEHIESKPVQSLEIEGDGAIPVQILAQEAKIIGLK